MSILQRIAPFWNYKPIQPIEGYDFLRPTCYLLPAACYLLPAACYLLPAACYLLPATCSMTF